MIREEKNALVLVLLFGVGAFVLYFFVLRPALDHAVLPVNAVEVDPLAASAPDPLLDQRPRSAKRMVTARALLRDAATGLPLSRVTSKVLGIADIAEPESRDAGSGVYLIEYLPSDASFGIEFSLSGYRSKALHQLRGEAKANLELGVIALVPERSIRGEVRDRAGKPIEKARVGAFALPEAARDDDVFERCRQLAEALRRAPLAVGTTDADGRFSLGPLDPRRYALHFVSDGFVATALPRVDLQFADAEVRVELEPAAAGRARFTLTDGRPAARAVATLVDARMPRDAAVSAVQVELGADGALSARAIPPTPHFVFVGGGEAATCGFGPFVFPSDRQLKLTVPVGTTLTGVVVDAFDVPIRGAKVEVRGSSKGAFALSAVTDTDGRYRLGGLPVGACRVRTSARGFASDDQVVPLASFGAEHRASLYRGGVLEGTVLATGKPLLGARVTVLGQGARAVTDEKGYFQLEGLAAGPARVRCDVVGYSTLERSVVIAHGKSTNLSFEPTVGGEIRVRVLDAVEAPVRGARVAAFPIGAGETLDLANFAFTDTDALGYARLRDLTNGEKFTLYVTAPGLAPARGETFELGADHLKKGFAFQLGRAASVTGRVVQKDGTPIGGASVRIESRRTDPFERFLIDRIDDRAITQSDGSFEFGGLPVGDFQVVVEAVGFRRTTSAKIPLGHGDRRTGVEVKVAAAIPVFGSVENEDRRPIELASVTLGAAGEKPGASHLSPNDRVEATDFAGRFYFFSPDPGAVVIRAAAEHVGIATFVVDHDAGAPPYAVVIEPEPKDR